MRHGSEGPICDWASEIAGVLVATKLSGPFILNDPRLVLDAARAGHGLGYLPLPEVRADLGTRRLRRVLAKFCPPFDGYHLCYMRRRNLSSALRLLIDRLLIAGCARGSHEPVHAGHPQHRPRSTGARARATPGDT